MELSVYSSVFSACYVRNVYFVVSHVYNTKQIVHPCSWYCQIDVILETSL